MRLVGRVEFEDWEIAYLRDVKRANLDYYLNDKGTLSLSDFDWIRELLTTEQSVGFRQAYYLLTEKKES